MPKEMKLNFKEQLKVGNEIRVQVKNVSEKGIELKYYTPPISNHSVN
jgi:hypothetical protein